MTIDSATGQIDFANPADGTYPVAVVATDPTGAEAIQRFIFAVGQASPNPNVPVITSTPTTETTVEQLYLYFATATDADGDTLTFGLLAAPTGMTIDPASGKIDWTPTSSQLGMHPVLMTVDDGNGGITSQSFTIDVVPVPPNEAPIIQTDPVVLGTAGESYTYDVDAIDPEGATLTYALESAPTGMTIDPATGLITWSPTAADLGEATVTVTSVDPEGALATQTYNLEIRDTNTAPTFQTDPAIDPGLTISAGAFYRYDALATDAEDDVTYELITGPTEIKLGQLSGILTWRPDLTDLGNHPITIRATDDRGLSTDQTFTIEVTPDDTAPIVNVSLAQSPINIGDTIRIEVSATDDVGIAPGSFTLTIDGIPQTLDITNGIFYTATVGGVPEIIATATDTSGNVGTGSPNPELRVFDPSDNEAPVVSITSPTTQDVVTYLTDVTGTVSDDNLEFYRLEYSLAGTDQWTTFHESPHIVGGTATTFNIQGTFDPTLLQNDIYEVRLLAQDVNGLQSFETIDLSVEAKAKLGNFRLEFNDLMIPLAGIPIQINRIYDTLDANRSGDFGFGWNLGLYQSNIRETVRISEAEQSGVASIFGANPFRTGSRVYITAPDGDRVGFTFDPVPEPGLLGTVWKPRFIADPGVYETLEVDDVSLSQNADGTFGLYLIGFPFNPDTYTLTTKDQLKYRYNQFAGIESITDRNEVTLTFTDTGITSSVGESIDFIRDDQGLITEIVDPAGNSIVYAYNEAGELISVTDQVMNETTMSYLSEPAHYLDEIVDPLGNLVSKTIYDDEGRVSQVVDASGNPVTQSYDLANNQESISDRLGNETQFVFDDRGNTTSMTSPLGFTQHLEFDADDNISAIVDAASYRTEMTYDSVGNLLTVTDALGGVVAYEYDFQNNVTRVVDALGREATAEYDSNGNLIASVNAEGARTEMTRDAFGRQSTFSDPFNNVTTFSFADDRLRSPSVVTWSDGESRSYEHNFMGQVTRSVDENGNEQLFGYDATGNLVSMTDTIGGVTQFTYEDGLLTEFANVAGSITQYEYDARRMLTKRTDVLGGITEFVRDAEGRVTEEVDPLGRTTSNTYDATGNLIELSINPTYSYEYDERGNLIAAISETGARTTYEYDALSRPFRVTSPEGRQVEHVFDAVGNVVQLIDGLGTTSISYDDVDRVVGFTDPLGISESWNYDLLGNMTSYVDGNGNSWSFEYDTSRRALETNNFAAADGPLTRTGYRAASRLLREIDPLGNDTSYTYDGFGNTTSVTDALGRITSYSYDERNLLIDETDPLNGVTSYAYDAEQNLVQFTDPLGRITSYAYDSLGRLESTTDALSHTTQYNYDATGNLASFTDARLNTTSYTYDALDRVVSIIDAIGNSTQYTYDADSNLLAYTDETGQVWSWEYDLDGQTTRATAPDGGVSEFEYDSVGLLTLFRDELGREETYAYDAGSRLISSTDAGGFTSLHGYDNNHNLTSFEDASGNVWAYTYDALDRQVEESDPFSNSRFYSYDDVSNLASTTDRLGRETHFLYDDLDRVIEERWVQAAGDRVMSFAYDAVGNLLNAVDPDSSYAFLYDDLDRVSFVDNIGTPGVPNVVLSYGYDEVGNLNSLSDQFGTQVSSTFDELNRLQRIDWDGGGVDRVFAEFDYNDRSGLTSIDRYKFGASPELVSESNYEFDEVGRMTLATHRDSVGAILSEFQYDFDLTGQLTQSIERGQTKDYSHDIRGQLVEVATAGSIFEEYTLDATGNRDSIDHQTTTSNRLVSDADFDYSYDVEGNLTQKTRRVDGRVFEYEYDFRNRLTSAVERDGQQIVSQSEYVYDSFDQKIVRRVDGVDQYTVYSGDRVWADFDDSGQVLAKFVYGDESVDHILARYRTGEGTAWYLADRMFSVRDMVDADGQIINSIDYDSFGNILSESDSAAGDRFKFTGREWEEDAGVYYYRARHYDPANGRFLTEDSFGLAAGDANFYRYVANAPTEFIDPSGHVAVAEYAVMLAFNVAVLFGDIGCVTGNSIRWSIAGGIPFTDIGGEAISGNVTADGVPVGGIPTPDGIDVEIMSCAILPVTAWANGVFAEWSTVMTLLSQTQKNLPYDCVQYSDTVSIGSLSDYSVFVRASCGGGEYPQYVQNSSLVYTITRGFETDPHSNCFIAGTHVLTVLAAENSEADETGSWIAWLREHDDALSQAAVAVLAASVVVTQNRKERKKPAVCERQPQESGTSDENESQDGGEPSDIVMADWRIGGAVDERPAQRRNRKRFATWTGLAALLVCFASYFGITPEPLQPTSCTTNTIAVSRPIETIQAGDTVLAWDEDLQQNTPRRVVQIFRNTTDHIHQIQIRGSDGTTQQIGTTCAHPFWVVDEGWVDSGELLPGDVLLEPGGKEAVVVATHVEEHSDGIEIYNFEVEGSHTYYAAAAYGDEPILVHNMSFRPRRGFRARPSFRSPAFRFGAGRSRVFRSNQKPGCASCNRPLRGRAKNKLRPTPGAGDHTVFRRGPNGRVRNYETFRKQTNPRDPKPFESVKRVDLEGESHFNKVTNQDIATPHTHDPTCPGGVRPSTPNEIP